MMMKICSITLLGASLAGCSTAHSWIYRPTNYEQLPQDYQNGREKAEDFEPDLSALSIDASRRLVMSQKTATTDLGRSGKRVTCSEPPPDAALGMLAKTALEASKSGASGTALSGKFSDEFATSVTALAKRSSNVEIWRTTSSTYCGLLMNGWKDEAERYLAAASQFVLKTDDSSAGEAATKQKVQTPAEEYEAAQKKQIEADIALARAESLKERNAELLADATRSGDTAKISKAQTAVTQANLGVIDAKEAKRIADIQAASAKAKADKAVKPTN